jgi:hypothetical protein
VERKKNDKNHIKIHSKNLTKIFLDRQDLTEHFREKIGFLK